MSIVCPQCSGKCGTRGGGRILDSSGNTENYLTPGDQPAAIPCSQCNGKGYQQT